MLNDPYRVRVLKLVDVGSHWNRKLHRQERFYGAARATERLKALTTERLEKLPGCNMIVEWTGHSFKVRLEPGRACIVFRKGTKPILIANLRLTKTNLSASTEARPRNQWAYGVLMRDHFSLSAGAVCGWGEGLGERSFLELIVSLLPDSTDERNHALNPSLPAAIGIRLSSRNPGFCDQGNFELWGSNCMEREYQVMDAMTLMAKFLVNVTKQNQLYLRMALQTAKVPLDSEVYWYRANRNLREKADGVALLQWGDRRVSTDFQPIQCFCGELTMYTQAHRLVNRKFQPPA